VSPRVSVLMACRDAADTVDEALAGALQSGVDLEVVAVDHGSVDETAQRLAAHEGVRVIARPREESFVDAVNAGLAQCRADVVARMDADDRMHPDRLSADLAALAADPTLDAVSCHAELFPLEETGMGMRTYVAWQNTLESPADHTREVWIEQPVCNPATTFRRATLERLGGYRDGDFPEDYDLFLRLLSSGGRLLKREAVHHAWRQHSASLTRTDARYSRDGLARAKAAAMIVRFGLEDRPLFIVGAGKEGRRIGRALDEHGVRAQRWFDVAPDKIGRTRRGAPVLNVARLAEERAAAPGVFVIGAVGTSGARGAVRAGFVEAGFVEGEDAIVVA